jgi:hypothetical protein
MAAALLVERLLHYNDKLVIFNEQVLPNKEVQERFDNAFDIKSFYFNASWVSACERPRIFNTNIPPLPIREEPHCLTQAIQKINSPDFQGRDKT